jgi:nucleotide-binding universal stress UspA family protein
LIPTQRRGTPLRSVTRPRRRARLRPEAGSPTGRAPVEPLRSIFVATDLSENACLAVDWASAVAREHGARLRLVHALSPPQPPSPAPELLPLPVARHEELQWALRRRLGETRLALRRSGLEVEVELLIGPPAPTLLDAIALREPDLVVVGTRGLTGFERLVLGSTAARLVRDSPVPVLTVHPGDAARAERIRTVLVPMDFSTEAVRAAELAVRLLGPAQGASRLILCHAYHLPAEFSALGSAPIADGFERARDEAIRRLTEMTRGLEAPGREIVCAARGGHPADVIDAFARRYDVDLVAMGTRGLSRAQRLLFGSTAERVLPHAPCPVLTVSRSEG